MDYYSQQQGTDGGGSVSMAGLHHDKKSRTPKPSITIQIDNISTKIGLKLIKQAVS
jgi:hypothetical protein